MKRMAIIAASALIGLGLTANVAAGYRNNNVHYEYAEVISAEPMTKIVRVETPRRECWTETEA